MQLASFYADALQTGKVSHMAYELLLNHAQVQTHELNLKIKQCYDVIKLFKRRDQRKKIRIQLLNQIKAHAQVFQCTLL